MTITPLHLELLNAFALCTGRAHVPPQQSLRLLVEVTLVVADTYSGGSPELRAQVVHALADRLAQGNPPAYSSAD